MWDFIADHAVGPTGGLVLAGVIVGVGSGWLFSRREVVGRDRELIESLRAEIAQVRAENAELWLRLVDAVRDPGGAAVRQIEHEAHVRSADFA